MPTNTPFSIKPSNNFKNEGTSGLWYTEHSTKKESSWPLVSPLRVSPNNCEQNSHYWLPASPSSLTTGSCSQLQDTWSVWTVPMTSPAGLLVHARTDPGDSALGPGGFSYTVYGCGGQVQAPWPQVEDRCCCTEPALPSPGCGRKFFPAMYHLYWFCLIFLPIHLLFSFLDGSDCLS